MTALDPIPYPDAKLRRILSSVRTIALVGASSNWNRPSYFVMKYLQGKGYRVIPVNPGTAGKEQLGERIYASLRDIPEKIDMVDVFRASDAVGPVVDEAIAIGAKVVWMQLGVRNDEAAAKAEAAGIEVIMNRCPKIEFGRLGGELSWSGVNSGIIRNKPAQAPTDRRRASRGRCRRRISNMDSRPGRCMRERRRIRRRARGPRRSTRRRLTCSTMSITPRRCSTCTISATSTRA